MTAARSACEQERRHVRHRADHEGYLVGESAGRDGDVGNPPTRFVAAVELQAGRVQRRDDALLSRHGVGGSGAGQGDPAAREDHTALGGDLHDTTVRQWRQGGTHGVGVPVSDHRVGQMRVVPAVCMRQQRGHPLGLQSLPQLPDQPVGSAVEEQADGEGHPAILRTGCAASVAWPAC